MSLAAAAGASCVDRVTGLGESHEASVTVALRLPAETPEVWYPRGDTLRVAVRRAGLTVPIADTAIVIGDELQATLDVPLSGTVERFVAQADVVVGELVFFLAFDALELRAGADTAVELTARYVGPAASAATLELLPAAESLAPADSTRLMVIVRDADGVPIANPPVRFVSLRPDVVAVRQDGMASAPIDAPADTARLAAWTPTGIGSGALVRVSRGTPLPVDGTIAFVSLRDGRRELYVARRDGSNARRLTNTVEDEFTPAWFPDGSRVVFTRDIGGILQLVSVASDGTGERVLTSEGANHGARVSPDGSRIAFTSTRGGRREVWTMSADGSDQRRLMAASGREDEFLDWSPDGRMIVFLGAGLETTDLYVAGADGSAARIVWIGGEAFDAITAVRWSPLGGRLAVTIRSGTDHRIIWSDLLGSSHGTAASDSPTYDARLAFDGAPDRFVFESEDSGVRGVYSRDPAGVVTRLSPAAVEEYEPDALPPSEAMYIESLVITASGTVVTSDQDGAGFLVAGVDVRGATVPVSASWTESPPGHTVPRSPPVTDTTTVRGIAPGSVFVIADYGGWRRDSASLAVAAAIAPNPQRIVLVRDHQIYTVRGDGMDTIRLTAPTPSLPPMHPVMSPDRTRIAWTTIRGDQYRDPGARTEVWIMNADGSGQQVLFSEGGIGGLLESQVSWSPDSRQLVFASSRVGRRQLYVMNADGTGLRQLTFVDTADDAFPAWSPDGSLIAFERRPFGSDDTRRLYLVPAAGGPARAVATGATLSTHRDRRPAWTPDNGALLYDAERGGRSRIVRLPLTGGAETFLTDPAGPLVAGGDIRPSVASDGLITFTGHRYGGPQQLVMRANGEQQSGVLPPFGGADGQWEIVTAPRYVARVQIGGDVTTPLAPGATRQLTASGFDQHGQPITPAARFTWRSLDVAVATVDSTGLVTSHLSGTVRIVLEVGVADPDTVTLTVLDGAQLTWVGGASGDPANWANPANWSPARVPSSADTVVVPATGNHPVLTGNAVASRVRLLGGHLSLGAYTLTVGGDFDVGDPSPFGNPGGMLRMQHASARLVIGGHASFAGGDHDGWLTAGEIRVRGDFRQRHYYSSPSSFQASEAHRVVLDGTGTQIVNFDSPAVTDGGSHFAHLEIAKPSGEVRLDGRTTAMGDLTVASPTLVNGPQGIWLVGALTTVAGSAIAPAYVRLWGAMQVGGTFTPAITEFSGTGQVIQGGLGYGDVRISGGATLGGDAVFAGNLRIADGAGDLSVGEHQLTVGGDFQIGEFNIGTGGLLRMTHPDGVLRIRGNAMFNGHSTSGLLTAGTMHVAGEFRQRYYYSSAAAFSASGSHRVVLDGTAPQLVHLESADTAATGSHFRHLEIANAAGIVLDGPLAATGDVSILVAAPVTGTGTMTVTGTLASVAGSSISNALVRLGGSTAIAGTFAPAMTHFFAPDQPIQPGLGYRDVRILGRARVTGTTTFDGDVIVTGGTGNLDVGAHALTITGDFQTGEFNIGTAGVLTMQDAAGVLRIAGNATFDGASTHGLLTAGTLRLAGNFSQRLFYSSAAGFAASGTHRVILDGATAQTVAFDNPDTSSAGSHFAELVVANAAGVTFLTSAATRSSLELDGSMTIGQNLLVDVFGALTLRSGAVLTNAGTLRYTGPYTNEGATINGNAPVPRS